MSSHKNLISQPVRMDSRMIENLFFHLLPVQIFIFAMGSVNTLVDGAIAGRYIDAASVGVIGLYYSLASFFTAAGNMILGGTSVLCGRHMGRGDLESTRGIFSLNLTITFGLGALFTALCLLFPGALAGLLGANDALKESLKTYIMGCAFGILPMLLSQQLAAFLQMERQSARGTLGIAAMILSNIVLDILFIVVWDMGVFGLALATSLSNFIYCLILLPYYFTGKAQLRYKLKNALWKAIGSLLKIGFPGALLVFCLAIRGIVINRILLQYTGSDGLSAMSALNMVNGLFIAYCLGNGAVVRMLISIFSGEEDKRSMGQVLKTVFTKGMGLAVLVTAAVVLLTPLIASLFFPDRGSQVYAMARQLFTIYGLCIPLILVCTVSTNYFQAMGHNLFVNIVSVFDGFLAMVIPALILAPVLGATGIWLASPIGIVLTIALTPIYAFIYWKRRPRTLDEWMFIKPGFGVADENNLEFTLQNGEDVSRTAEAVQRFCEGRHIEKRSAYHAALCMEEMAANVVEHGVSFDHKPHSLTVRVIRKNDGVLLRLKDDCQPFDPREMASFHEGEDITKNMGIRMVDKLAREINYQNLLGLNVLSIYIAEEDLRTREDTEFMLEKALRKQDPALHGLFKETVFAARQILSRFKILFPEYTDHSEFHSLNVVDACNRLIGNRRLAQLNADEIYILLVSCYLHDLGMGISEKDYDLMKDQLGAQAYFDAHPGANRADFVRDYHKEFSGLLIEKYGDFFEFPSQAHGFAIRQVARGHRRTDLMDEEAYPAAYPLPNGNTVCLPYLAALIRIADEIDVVATRNPLLLYDLGALTDEKQILENKKLQAVRAMKMTGEAFILSAMTREPEVKDSVLKMADKMQLTLDYCRNVIQERTPLQIDQKVVELQWEEGE